MYLFDFGNLPMSNWQAAEEGDIQDDFEFDLDQNVIK